MLPIGWPVGLIDTGRPPCDEDDRHVGLRSPRRTAWGYTTSLSAENGPKGAPRGWGLPMDAISTLLHTNHDDIVTYAGRILNPSIIVLSGHGKGRRKYPTIRFQKRREQWDGYSVASSLRFC
jgi:hypothetical protein